MTTEQTPLGTPAPTPEQATPEAPKPAPVAAPEPPKPDPEIAAKLARLAELEAKEAAAEKAKLSEAERLKAERDELNRERFQLELQKAGLTPEAAAGLRARRRARSTYTRGSRAGVDAVARSSGR